MFDLAIAALIGFPFGVLVGYLWRDRISRARHARFLAERERRPLTG
jgi:NhaP-type Na+/H+ or K+/H+ antiporter